MKSFKFVFYALLLNLLVLGSVCLYDYHVKQLSSKSIAANIVRQQQPAASIKRTVATAFKGKVLVDKIFQGQDGLVGLVLSRKADPLKRFIAYEDLSSNTFLLGQIVNHNGVNLTLADSVKYIQNKEKITIYRDLLHWPSIITGSKTPLYTIYIVVDPNSSMFAEQYNNLLLDERDSRLAVHWILVNYLRPMGPNLAGWVLSSRHPQGRLAQIAAAPVKFTDKKDAKLSHDVTQRLRKNWLFVAKNQLAPGPSSVFKVKDHVYVVQGLLDTESLDALFFSNQANS